MCIWYTANVVQKYFMYRNTNFRALFRYRIKENGAARQTFYRGVVTMQLLNALNQHRVMPEERVPRDQ